MCVIIIKQKGMTVPSEVAKTSARINPHGLGVIWLDTFEVTYYKSSEYAILNSDRPFIAHFRYATVGAINRDNTHPFRCGSNKNEWLMMNGTIKGIGSVEKSDSRILASSLGDIPRHTWKAELEKHTSRFVTVNTHSRTFQIYNQDLWVQRGGVWYSKDNVLEENLVAVYGTLKKGYNNYWHYLSASKFIGCGTTQERYPLIIKGLPYMINDRGVGYNVDVDVFKVSDSVLRELDRLECHPNWYCRKIIAIDINGKVLNCWLYFNIKETVGNSEMHFTYTQRNDKPKYSTWYQEADIAKEQESPKTFDRGFFFDDVVEEDDQACGVDEKAICVECFHDLDHDGFSNYHCTGCDGWFTESDVLMVNA